MKTDYKLIISDNTMRKLPTHTPDYNTDKIQFKEWFEKDTYRDEVFVPENKLDKLIGDIPNRILYIKNFDNIKYREAMYEAEKYLNEKMELKDTFTSAYEIDLLSIE